MRLKGRLDGKLSGKEIVYFLNAALGLKVNSSLGELFPYAFKDVDFDI